MMETQHKQYMEKLKKRKPVNTEPLSEDETKRLKTLDSFDGVGVENYLKWFKSNPERDALKKKRRAWLQRAGALWGGCGEGESWNPITKQCEPDEE